MKNKQILFVDLTTDPALERVARRALVSTGCNFTVARTREEADKALQPRSIDLLLINYDDAGTGTRDFVTNMLKDGHQFYTVLVSQKKDKDHLIDLFSHDRLRNLIARNGEVEEKELIITTEKLLRQDIFGLDKYFVWGVEFVQEVVGDSQEKGAHIQRVADFVRSLKCDERFVRLAEIVADELLMNALYDAPIDDDGKALYASLPRTERVQLEARDRAILEYGSDGQNFAIACRDRFGALKAQTVVNYLRKCFAQDDHQIDTKAGGAGVGFYMIFQSLSQLVINIEPGKMTETVGLIDIRKSYRDTKSKSKSFNIFVKQT